MPSDDAEAYAEYLRTCMYQSITARVNATFAWMEEEGVRILPPHAGLIVEE